MLLESRANPIKLPTIEFAPLRHTTISIASGQRLLLHRSEIATHSLLKDLKKSVQSNRTGNISKLDPGEKQGYVTKVFKELIDITILASSSS
jgi:hypothetical protein